MTIDLKLITDRISQLNMDLDDLTVQLDQVKTEVLNLSTEKKELDFRLEDEEKIKQVHDENANDSHNAFSARTKLDYYAQNADGKEQELEYLKLMRELLSSKLSAKEAEKSYIMEKVEYKVDELTYMETIKKSIERQVGDYNNDYFVLQLKEIIQKKRLIAMEKTKYSPVISKIESQILEPLEDDKKMFQLGLSFIPSDPIRAKQELEKAYDLMSKTIDKTKNVIDKFRYTERDSALCDALNSYIGDLTQIYPEIKFRMTVANLELINNINMDLNRCMMAYFRGLINVFILKCAPQMIYLRFAYEDGYLNITGQVIGKYMNFYNEMKESPSSIVANVYEKVFLLNGTLSFNNKKDGTFNVYSKIPIKNYLT